MASTNRRPLTHPVIPAPYSGDRPTSTTPGRTSAANRATRPGHSNPPFGYASGPMSTQATWELLARCSEIARQLRDIGEEQHAEDITTLVAMTTECQGRH